MNKIASQIPFPFNPEEFRKEGHILVDTLSDYLKDALSGNEMPVLPWNDTDLLGSIIGYTTRYDGILTHGGTAGNLTAMLAARQAKTDYNIWEEGVHDYKRPGYMISEQAHYSIGRNVKIMGLGNDSIIKVPVDSHFRMRTDMLEEIKSRAEKRGIKVISVIASSCSTATGSYDDLETIADFCEKHGLWMHVDGAHGMGVLFILSRLSLVEKFG